MMYKQKVRWMVCLCGLVMALVLPDLLKAYVLDDTTFLSVGDTPVPRVIERESKVSHGKYKNLDGFTNSIGMTFVWIEPGTFMMGSPETEEGRDTDERQHEVSLTKGYFMQTTEVTQKQWKSVMGISWSGSKNKGDDFPVCFVAWDEAQEFIMALNKLERKKKHYRLPTEAEWEYACRAGEPTPFHTGETISKNQANYNGNSLEKIAHFDKNSWGLHDMHGNVWEWCQDRYGDYPKRPVKDPFGPMWWGEARVIRGGSWDSGPRDLRAANRDSQTHFGVRYVKVGFRVVVSGPPGESF